MKNLNNSLWYIYIEHNYKGLWVRELPFHK